ncbi:MAG: SRPBCC family protein [Anaerolineae bacterium]|nr:SRPBCC family protein [Anaerolineae bacterium]
MSVIEHSILIPTAVENVWQFISNIENNALWLADCRSIAFLTSYKQGRGARWRHTSEGGRDYVIEITNWYERVGYRYIIVNGSPYATNAGVIRLQETPEGTIVQWTFEYTLSGFLSGVRNAVSLKRGIEGNIIDSLQTLYKQVNKSKSVIPFSPKSLMQEAPDAEARAHYKPRHPSTFADKPDDDLLTEPPISEDDTKERPVVKVEAEEIQTNLALNAQEIRATVFDNNDEPSFLSGIDADTAMNIGQKQSAPPPIETPSFLDTPEKPTVEVSALSTTQIQDDPFELPLLNEPSVSDSSQLSVFELFGLPKPSETQQMQAVKSAEIPDTIITTPPPIITPPMSAIPKPVMMNISTSRIGKRILLRRNMVKLRKP